MKLDEVFLTQTKNGLAECEGKRINSDYAVITPWFSKDEYHKFTKRYYIIHISSGLKVSLQEYSTIKAAIDNFEEDFQIGLNKLKEKGITFEQAVKDGERRFNELLNMGKFWRNKL